MTINDAQLNEQTVEIQRQAAVIDCLTREAQSNALFVALAKIEDAARKAQWRLLELK